MLNKRQTGQHIHPLFVDGTNGVLIHEFVDVTFLLLWWYESAAPKKQLAMWDAPMFFNGGNWFPMLRNMIPGMW